MKYAPCSLYGRSARFAHSQKPENCSHMRVSITIPVYNEESCLADSLKRLHGFLSKGKFGWDWEIVVADNGSTDRTKEVADQFKRQN